MYASGPFTRVVFDIDNDLGIIILIPRKHSDGHRGDLVNTIVTIDPRYTRLVDVYSIR